jgi:LCP family protein required for cell wall assembly
VPIPGFGTNKINSALVDGGPELMAKTVEAMSGIHLDFWMITSFQGLTNMVNGIGGLTVDIPFPMHDIFSHAFFKPGVQHITGKQALAFARNRHDTPNGDFTRSADQGILLKAALNRLHTQFATDPGSIFNWISVGWGQIHSDLSVSTLLQLGLTATQVPVANVNNLVVPATTGTVGAASVVFITSAAKAVYADMKDDGVVEHG